jgi:F-type H+-transporting ATPase subunit epsilon
MADMLNFELVSPERKLSSVEAEAVTIPGMMGDLTAMANHAPFLTNLRPGFVVVRNGSSVDGYFVTGGFAEISSNTVSILAEEAIEKAALDRAFIEEKLGLAEQALADAAPARKQAALQKLNDYKALLGQVSG